MGRQYDTAKSFSDKLKDIADKMTGDQSEEAEELYLAAGFLLGQAILIERLNACAPQDASS